MQASGRNPRNVLGVAEDASLNDLRRAFHRLAKQTHPDANGGGDSTAFRDALAAFEELSRFAATTPLRPLATPYDRWAAAPSRPRVWTDNDPLVSTGWSSSTKANTPNTATTSNFADFLESELTYLRAS